MPVDPAPAPAPASHPEPARGPLGRLLNVFADVRQGEAVSALLMVLAGFLLLLSYYLVKVVREPLIVGAGEAGAEWKSYAAGGQAVLLVGVLWLYDWLYARTTRMKLITWTYLFFFANLLIFFALSRVWGLDAQAARVSAGVAEPSGEAVVMGVGFFLWVGIFSAFVIAQFWSFANDVYTEEQGKRLFGFIAIGGTVGAATGSSIAAWMIGLVGSEFPVMPVGAAVLLLTLGLLWAVNRREHRRMAAREAAEAAAEAATRPQTAAAAPDKGGGFKLVLSDKYLLLIALLIVVLNWVNSTGEYVLDRFVKEAAAAAENEKAFIGSFRGEFFTYVNIVVLLLQTLVVSRFIQHLGVRVALFVLPAVAMLGYASLAIVPVLAVVKVAKIAENSIDYSLQNTTQQALWLRTTRAAKYKAKAVIDTFFKRAGDVLAAVVVFVGSAAVLDLGVTAFILLNMVLGAWLLIARGLAREHRRREEAAPTGK